MGGLIASASSSIDKVHIGQFRVGVWAVEQQVTDIGATAVEHVKRRLGALLVVTQP